ncbi:MAG: RNA 2',3'-cyclic phosphodiesterase [Armatimonadota bacterium]|nr:RNA 2',3'-cyclic phosphodiesterase [Armatimonadota bacterium]MDR7438398.1 RNA 2',3'-cyclic phosphodiesterase [Armatimonadota bacterium]MDR7563876.1 RNA 2',3'-cyclic phosphodiesterase [Armatimonadota bacterium]MDR7568429.1 RNA 2',3'-cyclic phosphodiesterase [Armatimonadota bacterium]MDR7601242.1 RNA 2',3'-cyclic phosphodiesterase [Armatimonadota bacterium]
MRLFVAVPLAGALRPRVEELQRAILQAWPEANAWVKWVESHNLHFTLKFLGEVPEERVRDVTEAVRGVEEAKPFEIAIEGLGAFPNLRAPRVLWVGVTEGAGELVALARRVEDALFQVRFPREARPFEPHLTIGRIRPGKGGAGLVKALERSGNAKIGRQRVEWVVVMESRLSPKGPTYVVQESIRLSG